MPAVGQYIDTMLAFAHAEGSVQFDFALQSVAGDQILEFPDYMAGTLNMA